MKNIRVVCELCDAPASINCDSDSASLCWRCDHKVHGANFLVAKHKRCLLCHNCQAMTPWTASGAMIPPSMSLCLSCVSSHNSTDSCATQLSVQSRVNYNNDEDDDDDDDDDEGENESSLYEEDCCSSNNNEDEDTDVENNQVVPLTALSVDDVDSDNSDHLLTALPTLSLKRSREVFTSS